ncbi:PilZ domain-containing protein [Novosphingobium fuchskuhlense]|nr:PilZ domain-containing protein [Novosphingobium fuchskuhlense]
MSTPTPQPIVPMPRITGRRAMPRVRLYVPAQVELLQGTANCLLDDLSQTGARVTMAGRMPTPGANLVLRIQGLDAFGTVVWSQSARFGIQFEDVLPLHDVVNLRHFADAYVDHEADLARSNARQFVQGPPRLQRQT